MHRFCLASLFASSVPALVAADVAGNGDPVELSPVTVYSSEVANQEPAGSFAMPVSALRYEPLVDVQARNLAEGQADISIRGGTFENTGFSIGAVPIYDPQTGHYFAELPVAPAMLGAPQVRTGADNSLSGWNATAGSVGYAWQPVRSGGFASVGAGENDLFRAELYSGYASDAKIGGRTLAADVSVAYSESDGSRPHGDHEFARYNARLQLADETSQTDLFAGYQTKFFGWQNLYAGPFNSNESEDLQTTLVVLNHRVNFGADGDYFQAGAYYRRNEDDYQFNRFAPNRAFIHTTEVFGAGLDGRVSVADATAIRYRAGAVADAIESTSLGSDDRTQGYAGAFGEHRVALDDRRSLLFVAGANLDVSNRSGSAVSPVAELSFNQEHRALRRVYLSYSESTQLPTYTASNSSPVSGFFRGDPDLGRSEAKNLELGAGFAAGEWDLQASVFLRRDENLVDWVFNPAAPGAARVAVQGDIDTVGFEAIARRRYGRLDLVLGYAWLHKNEDYLTPATESFYAYNFPTHRLTAALVARLGAGFELRMDNEYRVQEDNSLRRRNDEVVLSSLGLHYAVPGVRGLALSVQVDNLWNSYFEEVPLVPGSRREVAFGARYAW